MTKNVQYVSFREENVFVTMGLRYIKPLYFTHTHIHNISTFFDPTAGYKIFFNDWAKNEVPFDASAHIMERIILAHAIHNENDLFALKAPKIFFLKE